MKFTQNDTDGLLQLMRWRRDVRHFKSDPLDETSIATLQKAMALAPSVGNSRPWRVIRVDSDRLRSEIIRNFCSANRDACKMYSGSKRDQYVKLKLEGLREAPLHLAVFTDLNPVNGHGLGRQTMAETLNYSTVSAINHLWLTARTLNIGVGWVSILQDRLVNQTLNVPADWKLTAYLCIGYPKEFTDEPELQRQGWQSNDEPAWVSR